MPRLDAPGALHPQLFGCGLVTDLEGLDRYPWSGHSALMGKEGIRVEHLRSGAGGAAISRCRARVARHLVGGTGACAR
jgi:hypothetical protein